MSTGPIRFLVSSAGRRGELVEILRQVPELLGRQGAVFAIDRSPLTAAGWLADGLDLVPPIHSEDFIDAVLDVCKRREITHLIPTIDTELQKYAEARERFRSAGVSVWVSAPETVRIARDKRFTHQWLTANGFPTVHQWRLSDAYDVDLTYPLIAKPAQGSSSVGLAVVRDATHLATLDRSLDYVVESVAPGVEHTIDVLVDRHGICQCAVPRRRLETRAGEVSKGLTVRDEDLISLGSRVAEALPGAFGILNIQVFKDPSSRACAVIEINARVGGGFPLTWAAGAHLPAWLAEHLGGVANPTSKLAWREDLLMLRYDAASYLPMSRTVEL